MITLRAQSRKITGKGVEKLRQAGLIPAVVYGPKRKSAAIQTAYQDIAKIFRNNEERNLINLVIDESKPISILIQDIQYHPTSDQIIHLDFYQILKGQILTTEVGLEFIGEAPAVKELAGTLIIYLPKIKIECLSEDIQASLKVDVSSLKTFEDLIRIKDLSAPKEWKILHKDDELIVKVEPPRKEEKPEELVAKPVEEVEKVEKIEKPAKIEESVKEQSKKPE